jgi:hypothetical protein
MFANKTGFTLHDSWVCVAGQQEQKIFRFFFQKMMISVGTCHDGNEDFLIVDAEKGLYTVLPGCHKASPPLQTKTVTVKGNHAANLSEPRIPLLSAISLYYSTH